MAADFSGPRFSSSRSGSAARARPEARVPLMDRVDSAVSEAAPAVLAAAASAEAADAPVVEGSAALAGAVPAVAPDVGKPFALQSNTKTKAAASKMAAAFFILIAPSKTQTDIPEKVICTKSPRAGFHDNTLLYTHPNPTG